MHIYIYTEPHKFTHLPLQRWVQAQERVVGGQASQRYNVLTKTVGRGTSTYPQPLPPPVCIDGKYKSAIGVYTVYIIE